MAHDERSQLSILRSHKQANYPRTRIERHGAHGVGIGYKEVGGNPSDVLALRFYVAHKRPKDQLDAAQLIPGNVQAVDPETGESLPFPTDVIETPVPIKEVDPQTKVRPVPGGVNGGGASHSGTIGGFVADATDGTVVMLSNEHVLEAVPGVTVLQQSRLHGGTPANNTVGATKRGIKPSKTQPNLVDCAIAEPDSGDLVDARVLEIGPAVMATALPGQDMWVEKYGQKTRHTWGKITDADYSGRVEDEWYEDCLFIRPDGSASERWSAGGDSGALVFRQQETSPDSGIKPVVGLHFAGSGGNGIANKIQNVFDKLRLATLSEGVSSSLVETLAAPAAAPEEEDGRRGQDGDALSFPLVAFTTADRRRLAGQPQAAGLARDLHQRVMKGANGGDFARLGERFGGEMAALLLTKGDVRRAVAALLRPALAGAVTTTAVLSYRLGAEDIERLAAARREIERFASAELCEALKALDALGGMHRGWSVGALLGVEL